jgi:crotonobetainyl-CoA:carnitine CoA-transferase CaiB-like acyl-CoA transferase
MNNRVDEPLGNSDPDAAPMGCYPCSGDDAWVVIVVRTDDQWQALKRVLADPAWANDPRFDSVAGRVAARDQLDSHLAKWTRTLTPDQVFEQLKAMGVPAGPVYQADGPPNDPHLQERGFYRWVTHPLVGQYRRPGPLFDLKATPVQFRRHTNLLGEHNEEVLIGLLGVAEEEYDALIEANVIGTEYNPAFNVDPEDRT